MSRWPIRLTGLHRVEHVLGDPGGERHPAATRTRHDPGPLTDSLPIVETTVESLAVDAGPAPADRRHRRAEDRLDPVLEMTVRPFVQGNVERLADLMAITNREASVKALLNEQL